MTKKQYRQGDVLIIEAPDARPSAAHKRAPSPGGRVVLAQGSATGHAHAITSPGAVLMTAPDDDAILMLESDATLVHDEHDPIALPAGTFLVRIQRQWDGAISRAVED